MCSALFSGARVHPTTDTAPGLVWRLIWQGCPQVWSAHRLPVEFGGPWAAHGSSLSSARSCRYDATVESPLRMTFRDLRRGARTSITPVALFLCLSQGAPSCVLNIDMRLRLGEQWDCVVARAGFPGSCCAWRLSVPKPAGVSLTALVDPSQIKIGRRVPD